MGPTRPSYAVNCSRNHRGNDGRKVDKQLFPSEMIRNRSPRYAGYFTPALRVAWQMRNAWSLWKFEWKGTPGNTHALGGGGYLL